MRGSTFSEAEVAVLHLANKGSADRTPILDTLFPNSAAVQCGSRKFEEPVFVDLLDLSNPQETPRS